MVSRRSNMLRGSSVRNDGFSIVEVVVAIAVLGSALVASLELMVLANRSSDENRLRIEAVSELKRKVETLRQRGFEMLSSESRQTLDEDMANGLESEVTVTEVSSGLKKVTVTIYRKNTKGVEVGESMSFQVSSCPFPRRRVE